MHKMFKDAKKFQEKELTKQEIIANLKRKEQRCEIAPISPPKRDDDKLTTEEFIEKMEQVSSHNRTFKLPQEDEEEEKNNEPK